MSDIVEDLRQRAEWAKGKHRASRLFLAAADEIERLRGQLGSIQAKRVALLNYDRETMPLCPRCGTPEYGLPSCTDAGFTHSETCGVYRWGAVCAACLADMAVDAALGFGGRQTGQVKL